MKPPPKAQRKDGKMKIYLLRHGIAVERGTPSIPDDARDLTAEGIKKLKESAAGIRELIGCPALILSSPLIRAHRTAEIIAKKIGYKKIVLLSDLLRPDSPPAELRSELARHKSKKSVLLVGHEPDLGEFASYLLDGKGSFTEMKKGGLCCISFNHSKAFKRGTLEWLATPRMLKKIRK